MVDVHDKEGRSRNMSAIRSSGSQAEKAVWSVLEDMELEFEKNVKGIPASPDAFLTRENLAILVQGCFWHGHQCHMFNVPTTRREFWVKKINLNIERDAKKIGELLGLEYRVLLVWECAIRGKKKLSPSDLYERIEEPVCSDQLFCQIDANGIHSSSIEEYSNNLPDKLV
jgi:DNA mismatch endonuclease, patch repair protein